MPDSKVQDQVPLGDQARTPPPAAPAGEHLNEAMHDLLQLGQDYFKLAKLNWQRGREEAKKSIGLLTVAFLLGIAGVGPLVYGVVGLIVAKTPSVHELALVTTVAAFVCLIGAAAATSVAMRLLAQIVPQSKDKIASRRTTVSVPSDAGAQRRSAPRTVPVPPTDVLVH